MEYLDILDESGNKTGSKDTREYIHKLGLLHSEVAAFIYTNTGKVILQSMCQVNVGNFFIFYF